MTTQLSNNDMTTPVGATYTERAFDGFSVDSLRQGAVAMDVFDSKSVGIHRSIHLHRIVSVTMESGMFGPTLIVTHSDGTTTRISTYVEA